MKDTNEQKLIMHLFVSQKLTLEETMNLLNISESTARRLFAKLEQNGLAIRTHGGIQCLGTAITSYSFEKGAKINMEQKSAIGHKACELVEDGDVIFCDSGTTIRCFCSELALYLKSNDISIKFYTNSTANVDILSPHIEVNLIGGRYRANRKDYCGYLAEHALSGLYFTKSFVGADGCINNSKFTTTDFETAKMNEIAIKNSKETFLLVDSSKFSSASHVAYAPAHNLTGIVTDSGISEKIKGDLNSQGCRVILAK